MQQMASGTVGAAYFKLLDLTIQFVYTFMWAHNRGATMKTAKVFKQGNSQAVRLPKEFRFQDNKIFIRKQGDTILLIPKNLARWQHLKNCIGKFKGGLGRAPQEAFEERDWPQ